MKISQLLERLYLQRESASVLVQYDGNKYCCNSFSLGDGKVLLLLSATPGCVSDTIDDLRMFANHGDLDVCFVATFAYLDKDKKIIPIMDVDYDGRHVLLLTKPDSANGGSDA